MFVIIKDKENLEFFTKGLNYGKWYTKEKAIKALKEYTSGNGRSDEEYDNLDNALEDMKDKDEQLEYLLGYNDFVIGEWLIKSAKSGEIVAFASDSQELKSLKKQMEEKKYNVYTTRLT